jgi:predicted amidophosphoribosyltransferase
MTPRPVTCPQCAASLPPGTRRCEYCGTYFDRAAGDAPPTPDAPADAAPGDPFVLALRAMHKELKGYSGSGSSVTVLIGLVATLGVLLGGLLWWQVRWTLVATAVTALAAFIAIGVHVGRERSRRFDAELLARLERLETEHGLDREATIRIAQQHLPDTSDLRQGIERSRPAGQPRGA